MISQFYVLSPRGDTIITRDLRGDVAKGTAEIFFRKVKFWSGDAPPVFNMDGVNYAFVKRSGIYFVATTNHNISAALLLEFLHRVTKVLKDFCGVLNEEAIRKNFVLIYEILDEMFDFGYPQLTKTEQLKYCIRNEAQLVEAPEPPRSAASVVSTVSFPRMTQKTVPSKASHRPVGAAKADYAKGHRNEIFVDILERVTVALNAEGAVLNSLIDGSIQLKSYLSGSPELKLALNEDVTINNFAGENREASRSTGGVYGSKAYGGGEVILDDCNFHECVDLKEFDSARTLTFWPPDGEFVVMNYRLTSTEFRVPFRIRPTVDELSPTKLELVIRLRADIPENCYGGNVVVSCAIPKHTVTVVTDAFPPGVVQSSDFSTAEGRTVWHIKKFVGGTECSLRARIILSQPLNVPHKNEIGPVTLNFEIPMYILSNLQVRYLRISDQNRNFNPYRWVRYVTQSSSYVCRL